MIDPTAIVHPDTSIDSDVAIGPYSVINKDVSIGSGTVIGSHSVINGPTKIGSNNKIFHFCSIGEDPQDKKYDKDSNSYLEIGSGNTIREYVSINRGTSDGGGTTSIGNNNWIMAYVHIAHDCKVGNNVVIANNVPLGGHVTLEDSVVIGGNSAVQQFTRIGRLAMIGGMTGVLNDVIPFGLSFGNRNYLKGLNLIGLRRNNYENKKIIELSDAFKKIFISGNLHENVRKINGEYKANNLVKEVTSFILKDKKRPICSPLTKE